MSLISILIALVIETYDQQVVARWRKYDWYNRYHDWIQARLAGMAMFDGPLGLVLNLFIILFLVWMIDAALGGLFMLFSFAFGIAVLLYCLGPQDLDSQVHRYIDAVKRGDTEAANFYASEIYGQPIEASPDQVQLLTKHAILIEINVRIISVLFWFTLLGPVGAMLFRLTQILKSRTLNESSEFAQAVINLHKILIWVPARICVLSFALAGNFVDTFSRWKSMAEFLEQDSEELLIESGMGALQQDDAPAPTDEGADENQGDDSLAQDVEDALALAKRTLIVFIAILAIFTIAGWLT